MVTTPRLRILRAPLRVLLVEDSEDDALLILRELQRSGYETEHERVETAGAMRAALGTSSWDVIFSDHKMPRFGAAGALELAREIDPEAPFIVVSGWIGEDAAMRAGAYDYVMKDNLARLCPTVERGLEEAEERRERRRTEEELRRRDAIFDAVRFASDQFLGESAGWEESVHAVLLQLGEAAKASRVYIFENFTDEDGELWATQRYEWVAAGVPAQMDKPVLRAIPYRAAGFGRWVQALGRGDLVYGHVRDFPESEQPTLRAQEILSMALVPIFVEGRWWGVIGFDECVEEREWSAAQVGALGAAAGTLGAAIKRRQMEEHLRAGEERYRAVIERATDGIYLLDAETRRFVETNPSFQKMVGYTADELEAMEIYRIVDHPRENVDATIQQTLELRRRVVGNRKYRRKDGAVLDVEVGVSVISLDGRDVICTIVRDVTERKRAEAALSESERLYRTVIEQATENIFLMDVESRRIVESNASFRESLGYSEDELRSMTIYDVVAADRVSIDANIRRVLEQGNPSVGEREYIRKDGTPLAVEVSANVILRDGKRTLVSVAHDVTERARMQALLEERVATLSRIAADLALDLPMEDTLNALAASVVSASTAVSCLIVLIDEEADEIRLAGSHGVPDGYEATVQVAYEKAGDTSPVREAIRTHRPVLFSNARTRFQPTPVSSP